MISTTELENVFDALAEGIDRATPEKSELFLTKLVLLLANELETADAVIRGIEAALQDL